MFHVLTKRLQPQKKRINRFLVPAPFHVSQNNWFYSWIQIMSQARGLISWRLVERIFIWGKRIVRYPHQRERFWVNLQCGLIYTRKAKNSRMGKGKGSQAGRFTRISSGALIIAFSGIREGRLLRIFRQISVRCPFAIGIKTPDFAPCVKPLWIRFKRSRRRYSRLASARAWGKVRNFKQQRIFEFVTLVFFWLQKQPALVLSAVFARYKSTLLTSRYQTAALSAARARSTLRWLWLNTSSSTLTAVARRKDF